MAVRVPLEGDESEKHAHKVQEEEVNAAAEVQGQMAKARAHAAEGLQNRGSDGEAGCTTRDRNRVLVEGVDIAKTVHRDH